MDGQATKGLISFFGDIPDHRARNRQCRLIDLFAIAVMAVIGDAQAWAGVATFGVRITNCVYPDFSEFG